MGALLLWTWLFIIFAVGIRAGWRRGLEGYWCSDREAGFWSTMFSNVSTNIGAGALLAIAGSAYSDGTGYGLVAGLSVVTGYLAIGLLAPRIKAYADSHKAVSMCEILGHRFGRATQLAGAAVVFVVYVLIFAAQLLGFSHIVAAASSVSVTAAIVFAGVSLVVYSAFAGVPGDLATDRIHFVLMGAYVLVMLAFCLLVHPASSWAGGIPARIWSPLTFGGPAFLIVGLLLGVVFPLLSSENYVRVFSSMSAGVARRAFLWSALGVIPFYACAVVVGLFANAKYAGTIGDPDTVFLRVMDAVLPTPLAAFGLAALASVILSSANTLLVVLGSVVWKDVLNRQLTASATSELRLSRLITFCIGCLGLIFAYMVRDMVELLLGGFYVLLALAPSLLSAFVWKRGTAKAAVLSIVVGVTGAGAGLVLIPRQAFLPALGCSTLVFLVVSVVTRHSEGENPEVLLSAETR